MSSINTEDYEFTSEKVIKSFLHIFLQERCLTLNITFHDHDLTVQYGSSKDIDGPFQES